MPGEGLCVYVLCVCVCVCVSECACACYSSPSVHPAVICTGNPTADERS